MEATFIGGRVVVVVGAASEGEGCRIANQSWKGQKVGATMLHLHRHFGGRVQAGGVIGVPGLLTETTLALGQPWTWPWVAGVYRSDCRRSC